MFIGITQERVQTLPKQNIQWNNEVIKWGKCVTEEVNAPQNY